MSANAQRVFNVPKSQSKIIPLAIGLVIIVGVTVGIYFGVVRLKGESKETAMNDAGTTPASGPAAPPSTGSAASAPTTVCTTPQNSSLSSAANFTAWKTPYTDFITTNTPPAATTTLSAVNAKIAEVDAMAACLAEKSTGAGGIQTTNASLTADQQTLQAAIEQRKSDIQIAKDRALLAFDPNYNRSYYDGWFPLTRPLRESTTPVLIGISLFFMSMASFSVLAFAGIDTRILLPGGLAKYSRQ